MAIEGPSKAEISCVDNKDGTCSVSYLPTLPGDYNILVKYNDEHIAGSPFTAKITGQSAHQQTDTDMWNVISPLRMCHIIYIFSVLPPKLIFLKGEIFCKYSL